MGSPIGIDSTTLRPMLLALTLGAATLALIIRGAEQRRRTALVASWSQAPTSIAMMAKLEAVYRRGDITHGDFVELSRRIQAS
jgi:type III secretory pathway component EscT